MILNKGTILNDRYQIESLIGSGAISRVYQGFDKILNRKIAIKFFDSVKVSNARIQEEALLSAKIRHPNIISIYDVGIYQNNYFLVIDYIEGSSLQILIKSGKLEFNTIVKILSDISSALAYIHKLNILHRDLKPENIMVASSLTNPVTAYIADFGISKTLDRSSGPTETGTVVGTFAYMSPEQMRGEALSLKSDIYALGIIFYEMFTGQRPFPETNIPTLIQKVTSGQIPFVNEKIPGLPVNLNTLVAKMLSPDPAERPAAPEIYEELKTIKFNLPVQPVPGMDLPAPAPPKNETTVYPGKEIFETQLQDNIEAEASGFFDNKKARTNEFIKSISFYREHLDSEYRSLLQEAKTSFNLWVISFCIGFLVLVFAGVMFSLGKTTEGGISLLSEVFIYFVQNMFRIRENSFRDLANAKNKHLEIGNYWNLASQTIEAIEDSAEKQNQLKNLAENLQNIMNSFKLN